MVAEGWSNEVFNRGIDGLIGFGSSNEDIGNNQSIFRKVF